MIHLCIYGGVHIYVLLVTTTISRSVWVRLGVGLFFRSMISVHRWKKRSVRSQEQKDVRVVCMEKGVRGGFECGHFWWTNKRFGSWITLMTDSIVDNMIIGTDISIEAVFVVQCRLK